MTGHCGFGESFYPLQTIKDNVSLFTPEIPDKINQIAVKAGHNPVKKRGSSTLFCGSDHTTGQNF